MRALLLFVAAMLPVAALVFLIASSFFVQWDGQVVSHRPGASDDPAVLTVLIVGDESRLERDWDAPLVRELAVPVDPLALPPKPIPEDRPVTKKQRFAMHFLVRVPGEDDWRVVPTTSPRGLGLALVFLVVAVGVRNMIWAGSPFALQRRSLFLPKQQAQAGAPAPGRGRSGGRKGPPPGRKRRGRGRR